MRVVEFIRGCWAHSAAPLWQLSSWGVVGFTPLRTGGFGFIWVRLVHSGAPWGRLVHSGRWVHPRSLGSLGSALGALVSFGSLGSSEVVEFIRVRHGGRWVHLGSLG